MNYWFIFFWNTVGCFVNVVVDHVRSILTSVIKVKAIKRLIRNAPTSPPPVMHSLDLGGWAPTALSLAALCRLCRLAGMSRGPSSAASDTPSKWESNQKEVVEERNEYCPSEVLACTLLRNDCLPRLRGMAIFSPDTFAIAVIFATTLRILLWIFYELAWSGLLQIVSACMPLLRREWSPAENDWGSLCIPTDTRQNRRTKLWRLDLLYISGTLHRGMSQYQI